LQQRQQELPYSHKVVGSKFSLPILNNDLVVVYHVEADQDGNSCCNVVAVVHALFSDSLLLLQVVRILHFLLDSTHIAQKRDNFITMCFTLNLAHHIVSQTAWKTLKDGKVGEINGLFLFVVISDFNVKNALF